MTREKTIKYMESWENHMLDNGGIEEAEAFHMAIEALKAQEWTPCSEGLPKEWEHVLVTTDTPYTFNKIRMDWNVDNYWVNYGHHVIAWMPSPMPYRENEEDYELATEQMQHDAMYEPTYNSEDGSM